MQVPAKLLQLLSRTFGAQRGRRVRETSDQRAARKYWDAQVAADHEQRGVDDKHA